MANHFTDIDNNDTIDLKINQYNTKLKKQLYYHCQYCEKKFKKPSALKAHSYTHTGEKPHKCSREGCGRSFSILSNLRRHTKHKHSVNNKKDKYELVSKKYERQYSIIQPKTVDDMTNESMTFMMNRHRYLHYHHQYHSLLNNSHNHNTNQCYVPSSPLRPSIVAKIHYLGNRNQIPVRYINTIHDYPYYLLKTSSSPFNKKENEVEDEEEEVNFTLNSIHPYDSPLSASSSSSSSSSSSFFSFKRNETNFNQLDHFLHSDVDTLLTTTI
ncbi:unnamed protein product [Cunninghamella blakesleeana]